MELHNPSRNQMSVVQVIYERRLRAAFCMKPGTKAYAGEAVVLCKAARDDLRRILHLT